MAAEEEILAGIRAGGRSTDRSVRRFYETLGKEMVRFFVYQGVPAQDAPDVLQQTIVNIVRGAASFSSVGAAGAWMWQIARNCMQDYFRRKQTDPLAAANAPNISGSDEENLVPDPPEQSGNGRVGGADGRYLAMLERDLRPDECVSAGLGRFAVAMPERSYVLMLKLDGFSVEKIAERIGRTREATAVYLTECRRKLRPYIEHCLELLREQNA